MKANERKTQGGAVTRGVLVLCGFLAVAAYFLLSEHRAHFIAFVPYLLLAACPLMHLFHGHGQHGGHARRPDDRPQEAHGDPERSHQH